MSELIDTLVGRICLEKGWITQDQLVECLQKCDHDTTLSTALVSTGYVPAEQVDQIRKDVSDYLDRRDEYPALRKEDELLGQILVRRNHIKPEDLQRALAAQEQDKAGRLGEILIGMNALGVTALLDALKEQGQRVHLICTKCGQRFAVPTHDPTKKYGCKKCGHTLTLLGDTSKTIPASSTASVRSVKTAAEPEEVLKAAANSKNILGKYVMVKELGRGGMGAVYKAWDKALRRWVALKLLTSSGNEEDLARFEREAQTAAALKHPNIVGIYEVGEESGHHFIAMEYVDGRTLAGQRLPVRKAVETLIDVARAVEYAHGQGTIHRDLKPQNVMTDKSGKPFVMDFGLAKNVRGESQLTMSGTVVGTPSYMPPEQAQGKIHQLDRRSDVYSLGAVLYETLTGKAPFKGASALETLGQVVNAEVKSLTETNSAVPRDLETIVLKCLEKEKARRYPSARLFAEDLERWLRGEDIAARRVSMVTRVSRRVSKNKAGVIAAIAVVVAIVAIVGVRLGARSSAEKENQRLLQEADKAFAEGEWSRAEVLYQKAGAKAKADECRQRLDLVEAQARIKKEKEDLERREREKKEEEARLKAEADKKARGDAQPHYDAGRRNLEEAGKDLYRPGADLSKMRGVLETAVADFTKAIGICATFHEAWLGRGQSYAQLYRPDEAEKDFAKAIDLLPNYSAAYLARGRLHLSRFLDFVEVDWRPDRQPKDVLSWRDRAIEDFTKAQEIGNVGEELEFVKALLAYTEERADEVIALLTKMIDGGSKKEDYYKLRGDAFRKKAYRDRTQPDIQKAYDDYTEALRICVNHYGARRFRGALLYERGLFEEARQDFEAGLKINPDDSFALSDMGTFLERSNRIDEAETYYNRAIDSNPRNYRAWSNRGTVKLKRKEYQPAKADLEKALEIHPYYMAARHNMAVCVYNLGDERKAMELLDQILQDHPNAANVYNTRGALHYRSSRWKQAREDLKKCAELDARYDTPQLRAIIEDCEKRIGD